jgi:hypothetical protein
MNAPRGQWGGPFGVERNSLGSRGLRLELHGTSEHGALNLETISSNHYLRKHIGGGSGSHLDRRCEKPDSLSFAHEGQRMVAGVGRHLCMLLCTPCRQWIRRGRGQAAVGLEKGEFVCSWKSRYHLAVWSALSEPELSGTHAASSSWHPRAPWGHLAKKFVTV